MNNILDIQNLNITFFMAQSQILAVRDLSFRMTEGKTLGLVGESGCGKSVTAYSILRLISPPGKIVSGDIYYRDKNLLQAGEDEMMSVRGKQIAMIFQEPMSSLNPVLKIGFQISESIMLHLKKNKKEARELAVELLNQVGIPDPARRYNSYPHELSGGMRQRVMIAMSLAASPSVLIADEPTTALDVTIQAQILDLLLNIQKEKRMSLLLITHDLGIVANVADDVAIMYAGEIVESGTVQQIFERPLHPYTIGLFEAIPKIGENKDRLKTIPGNVPSLSEKPTGCVFYPRCFMGAPECTRQCIPLIEKENRQFARCIRI